RPSRKVSPGTSQGSKVIIIPHSPVPIRAMLRCHANSVRNADPENPASRAVFRECATASTATVLGAVVLASRAVLAHQVNPSAFLVRSAGPAGRNPFQQLGRGAGGHLRGRGIVTLRPGRLRRVLGGKESGRRPGGQLAKMLPDLGVISQSPRRGRPFRRAAVAASLVKLARHAALVAL